MWLYSILLDPKVTGIDRKALQDRLAIAGIETRPVWVPAHRMPFYKDAPCLGGAVGERLFSQGLSLPCSTGITPEQSDRVIDAVLECLSRSS